jgi:hypothetical protein
MPNSDTLQKLIAITTELRGDQASGSAVERGRRRWPCCISTSVPMRVVLTVVHPTPTA